jgi:hypothetical protein
MRDPNLKERRRKRSRVVVAVVAVVGGAEAGQEVVEVLAEEAADKFSCWLLSWNDVDCRWLGSLGTGEMVGFRQRRYRVPESDSTTVYELPRRKKTTAGL